MNRQQAEKLGQAICNSPDHMAIIAIAKALYGKRSAASVDGVGEMLYEANRLADWIASLSDESAKLALTLAAIYPLCRRHRERDELVMDFEESGYRYDVKIASDIIFKFPAEFRREPGQMGSPS